MTLSEFKEKEKEILSMPDSYKKVDVLSDVLLKAFHDGITIDELLPLITVTKIAAEKENHTILDKQESIHRLNEKTLRPSYENGLNQRHVSLRQNLDFQKFFDRLDL